MTRRILSDIATHPWPFAGFVACVVATVVMLADLGSGGMWLLVGIVVGTLIGFVVVTGLRERAVAAGEASGLGIAEHRLRALIAELGSTDD